MQEMDGRRQAGAAKADSGVVKCCGNCGRAFTEDWPRGIQAIRCGYKASPQETERAERDKAGVLKLRPKDAYGRVTDIYRKEYGRECVRVLPIWCHFWTPMEETI